MVDVEVRRNRIIIRYKGKKWDWIIEPRYWRNTLIWSGFLILFPLVSYFVSPILLNTIITANLYAAKSSSLPSDRSTPSDALSNSLKASFTG